MKPFKLPYRIAAAGAFCAAAAGVGGGAITSSVLRAGRRQSVGLMASGGLAAAAVFASMYYPPYCRRRDTPDAFFLTFDDGPDPAVTPHILDTLASHRARATFFIIGENARRHQDIVRRAANEGHTLAIHGYRHQGVTLQPASRIGCDLDAAARAIRDAEATAPLKYYRPTYGLRGPGLGPALRSRGLEMVLWTLDGRDYLTGSSELVRRRVTDNLQNGDIVLLHDAGEAGQAASTSLDAILTYAESRGWSSRGL